MFEKVVSLLQKPELYKESTSKFWNDEHISQGMLEAHLNPEWDSATRNHSFVDKSVDWIASILPPEKYPKLIDLGCGPGLYAERFYKKSYQVTGLDFSERSINYARQIAKEKNINIQYIMQSYLDISYNNEYDIATLIYCDFGVLSDDNRKLLLRKIYSALTENGVLIFDVFTPAFHVGRSESKTWEYNETGFFNEKPHS